MQPHILVISSNREFSPQPVVPLGAAWVAEALHRGGFQVRVLDLCFARSRSRALQQAVAGFRPDGIAVSVRNLDNCDFLAPRSFLPDLKQVTDQLQSLTDAPILLGGAGVSVMPHQVLDYLGMESAVAGEGEQAAVAFFSGAGSVPGLVRRGRHGSDPPCNRLAGPDLASPQLCRWVDVRRYLAFEPVLPVQGKRGCANRCVYCTYRRIEGDSWRIREPAAVVEEMAAMTRHGVREFEFVDSVFNEPAGYLESLLEEVIRRQLQLCLYVSSLSPRGLTRQQVALMERSGVRSVVVTPETACGTTLSALGKDYGEAEVFRAAELLAGSGIRALWCFLLGGPRETATTLRRTIRFINRVTVEKDGAFLTIGIRLYPHTGLHELATVEGVVTGEDDLLMPVFYFSPGMQPEEARLVLRSGLSHPRRCIFLSDTQFSWLAPLRRAGTLFRLPSPFWRYAVCLNRLTGGSRVLDRRWPERTGQDVVYC